MEEWAWAWKRQHLRFLFKPVEMFNCISHCSAVTFIKYRGRDINVQVNKVHFQTCCLCSTTSMDELFQGNDHLNLTGVLFTTVALWFCLGSDYIQVSIWHDTSHYNPIPAPLLCCSGRYPYWSGLFVMHFRSTLTSSLNRRQLHTALSLSSHLWASILSVILGKVNHPSTAFSNRPP